MKRQRVSALMGLATALVLPFLAGCGMTSREHKPAPSPAPATMAERLATLKDCGGIAVIGASDASTVQVAGERAQMKARELIADTIREELKAIQASVLEELGPDAIPTPYATVFAAAIQSVNLATVNAPIFLETDSEPAGYRAAAQVLVVHSPEIIKDIVLRHVGEDAAVRTHIEASNAMQALNKRIAAFDARKRKEGWQTEIEKLRIGRL